MGPRPGRNRTRTQEELNGSDERRPCKLVVTGAAGQFGMLVIQRLVDEPWVEEIVALDLRPCGIAHPKIQGVVGDVQDPEIGRWFEGRDTLIHLAFAIHRFKPRSLFDAINVGGSKNVFDAALAADMDQIVYASSVAAYGVVHGHPQPIPEDTPRVYQEEFAYARAKFEVEAILDELEGRHPSLVVTRLRPVVMVGAHMGSLMGNTLRRRRIPSTGDVPYPVVWDEDVADAVALVVEQRAGGAFNLCARDVLTARELARRVGMKTLVFPRWLGLLGAHLSNLGAKVGLSAMVDPAWIRTSDVPMVLDAEKARRELAWRPRCDTAVDVMRHFLETVPETPEPRSH